LFSDINDQNGNSSDAVVIFPNPANHTIHVSVSLPTQNSNSEIIIFNSLGQIVKNIPVQSNQSGEYSQQIDISSFSNGIYYLFLKSNNTYLKNTTFIKE
jgi:hypothetical protein